MPIIDVPLCLWCEETLETLRLQFKLKLRLRLRLRLNLKLRLKSAAIQMSC
jgi:hypothetical protein